MKRLLVLVSETASFIGCNSTVKPAQDAENASDSARITQFYASTAATPLGESTNLCYGVDNATSVKIDPPVESLKPSLARCFSVSPTETTTYTLTAEGPDHKAVTQSVTVTIAGARPKFKDLVINQKEVAPGEEVKFCFSAVNASKVQGGPGKFQFGGSPKHDCLVDKPQKTTTYALKIEGDSGMTDEESITVKVR